MVNLCLESPVYKIGDLLYSPTSAMIDCQGERIRLRAREANLLHELIKTFPEVLSRTAIEQTLWKDSYATNATINQTVKALRFSLQDVERTLIRTIPKQGYVLAIAPRLQDVIVKDEAEQESSDSEENVLLATQSNQKVIPTKPTKSSKNLIQSISALSTIAIATFVLGASGVFTSVPDRVSHQYGQHWILFNPDGQEINSLPIGPNDEPKYVTKNGSFYRVCSEIRGVLECNHVEL